VTAPVLLVSMISVASFAGVADTIPRYHDRRVSPPCSGYYTPNNGCRPNDLLLRIDPTHMEIIQAAITIVIAPKDNHLVVHHHRTVTIPADGFGGRVGGRVGRQVAMNSVEQRRLSLETNGDGNGRSLPSGR
jgi:hypothetical protein